MRLLILTPLIPYPSHSSQAVNVILFELLSALSGQPGIHLTLLKVIPLGEHEMSPEEKMGGEHLARKGVEVLPPLRLPKGETRPKWRKVFLPDLADFYADVTPEAKRLVNEAAMAQKPDVVLVPCSEWMAALASDVPAAKYAYYGNPDPKSAFARAEFERAYGKSGLFEYWIKRFIAQNLDRIHRREIRKYEMIGELAHNDVAYYEAIGHPNVQYVQNVWLDRFPDWRELRSKTIPASPPMIIGNIGRLAATANTHGLEFLGREYLPALRRVMGNEAYELHLFGTGAPHPSVAAALKVPEVRMRGFVDDIDTEILKAQIFMCLNNAGAYKVGHTRYLHAWSLGACVIAHKDASLSMPEIQHGKNALLGNSGEEIAELTKVALGDPALRAKIGEAGYQTFKDSFTAEHVVPKILHQIESFFKNRNF